MVVDQNRSRYSGKNRDHGNGSLSGRVFRDISRNFQCGDGILPTPEINTCKTPAGKLSFRFSPTSGFNKTTSVEGKSSHWKSRGSGVKKSSSVPLNIKVDCDKENYLFCKKLSFSERWAGPAYSNSPPPSSLPIPKFSVPSKQSVSLELACLESEIHLYPASRSAPASPKREHGNYARNVFNTACYASATKDLRRILNLDMDVE